MTSAPQRSRCATIRFRQQLMVINHQEGQPFKNSNFHAFNQRRPALLTGHTTAGRTRRRKQCLPIASISC